MLTCTSVASLPVECGCALAVLAEPWGTAGASEGGRTKRVEGGSKAGGVDTRAGPTSSADSNAGGRVIEGATESQSAGSCSRCVGRSPSRVPYPRCENKTKDAAEGVTEEACAAENGGPVSPSLDDSAVIGRAAYGSRAKDFTEPPSPRAWADRLRKKPLTSSPCLSRPSDAARRAQESHARSSRRRAPAYALSQAVRRRGHPPRPTARRRCRTA